MGLIGGKGQDSINYRRMQINLESSNSNETTENEIHNALNEAYELLRSVRDSGNEELYQKFRKEYKDLYSEIEIALQSNKDFSKSERLSILLELGDMIKLAEEKGIKEKRSIFDRLLGRYKDNSDSKEKARKLLDMEIKDFDKKEAIVALNYLSKNYNNYKKGNIFNKVNVFNSYNTINNLDNQYEVNLFEDELLKIIFGEGKNEDGEYLKGFNKEKGNYLIKISDFENEIRNKDIVNINSETLANYFQYLSSKGELNKNKLVQVFGISKLKELQKIWEDDKYSHIAKETLKRALLLENIIWIIDFLDLDRKKQVDIFSRKTEKQQEQFEKYILEPNNKEDRNKFISKQKKDNSCPENEKLFNILKNSIILKNKEEIKQKKDELKKEIKKAIPNITEEQINKLTVQFDKYLERNSCNIGLIGLIRSFAKENNLKLNIDNVSQVLQKSSKLEEIKIKGYKEGIKLEISNLKIKIEQLKKDKINKQELLRLESKLKELEKTLETINQKEKAVQKMSKVAFIITKEDTKRIFLDLDKGLSEEEIIENLINNNKEIKKIFNDYKKENNTSHNNIPNSNSNIGIQNSSYAKLNSFSSSNGDNSFTTSSGITINGISDKEFQDLNIKEIIDTNGKKIIKVGNPEALKNLINLKETLQELNLDFVWKYREDFYKVMRNIKGYAEINNLDGDNISKYELMNLLNFILKVIGEGGDFKDEEAAKKRIRDINGGWIAGRKKDIFTELGPIGTIFEKKRYLNRKSSLYVINIEKIQDQNNWKKDY